MVFIPCLNGLLKYINPSCIKSNLYNLDLFYKIYSLTGINYVKDKLKGINCNGRGTSCPDQLAKAIEELQ